MADLKILTLNCWGIWLLSSERKQRITAIASFLASGDFDIVLVQELFCLEDFETIKNATVAVLPFSHHFQAGVIGSGLCILSKHQITETSFHKYSLNGNPQDILHGDWYAGKGLGVCRMRINNLNVCVFITHLHAEYLSTKEAYLAHRVSQALEAAVWIKLCAAGADLVIVGGDFNSEPGDTPYSILREVVPLQDAWMSGTAIQDGETCGTLKNSYTNLDTLLPGSCSFKSCERSINPKGQRIDFIMFKCRKGLSCKVKSCEQPLSESVPGTHFSYSDHEAVSASIIVRDEDDYTNANDNVSKNVDGDNVYAVMEEAKDILERRLKKSLADQIHFVMLTFFFWMMLVSLRLAPFSGWITILFEVFCSMAGIIYLLIATIHLKKEQSSLKSTFDSALVLQSKALAKEE